MRGQSLEERFWAKADKSGECWLWTGAMSRNGYGNFNFEGKYPGAHRVAWILAHGPIPENYFVCHSCDVKRCVNPSHLFLGTSADNQTDMANKGRSTRGERHPNVKLTTEQVLEIRRIFSMTGLSHQKIADLFGVTSGLILQIVHRKIWKYLEDEGSEKGELVPRGKEKVA